MSGSALWLAQNAVVATAMAGVVALVVRLVRPRPAVEHVLWLLVAAKFVLPPLAVVALPAPVPEGVAAVLRQATPADPAPTPAREVPGRSGDGDPAETAHTLASGGTVVAADEVAADARLPFTAAQAGRALLALWLGGALLAGCWRLFRHGLWLRRLEQSAEAPPAELAAEVAAAATRLGIPLPRVALSSRVGSPLVTGLRRPVLYWPRELVGVLTPERARTIAVHELAHVRRRDLWSGMLELAVDCVWRWYPGWRAVRRRLRDAAERACDRLVVETYPASRRQYAEGILDVLTLDVKRRNAALALGVDGPGSMERRIEHILRPDSQQERRPAAWAGVAAVALALLPAWGVARPASPAAEGEATTSAPDETSTRDDADAAAVSSMYGVESHGALRWQDRARLPSLEPGAWLIAFGPDGDVMRRLEMVRTAAGGGFTRYVADGHDVPLDDGTVAWLRDVFERTRHPLDTRDGFSSSSSVVPDGSHAHHTDQRSSLSYWSAGGGGVRMDGTLDPSVSAAQPVYIVSGDADGYAFFALAAENGEVRLLEHSIDARARPVGDAAHEKARRAIARVAAEILRPPGAFQ